MKTFTLTAIISAALVAAASAQTPTNSNFPDPPQRSIATGTARDGFFIRGSKVYMVNKGVTTLVEREMLFPNGLRVLPDGTVTLRDGRETTLLRNQWLDFQGSIDDLSSHTAAPAPNSKVARESGVSSRDGVTMSGADLMITRNGVTEKVIADVRLPNGVVAKPDGTVVLANGQKVTLRADQVLDLHGVLHEAPVAPSPAGVAPSSNPPR